MFRCHHLSCLLFYPQGFFNSMWRNRAFPTAPILGVTSIKRYLWVAKLYLGQIWADLCGKSLHIFYYFLTCANRELLNVRIFMFFCRLLVANIGFVHFTPKYDLLLLLLVIMFDRFVKKTPLSEIGLEWASSQRFTGGKTPCESP